MSFLKHLKRMGSLEWESHDLCAAFVSYCTTMAVMNGRTLADHARDTGTVLPK